MNKILTWVGIILVVAGAIISVFAGIPQAELIGLASAMVGAGLLCTNIIKKAKTENKNKVLTYICIACIGIGAFISALAGISEDTMTQIIVTAIGLVSLIIGLVTSIQMSKKK